MYNLVTNIATCYTEVPNLLYYSHIPTAFMAVLLGLFVYLETRKSRDLTSRILFFVAVAFAAWTIFDLIIFVSPDSRLVMFLWSLVNLIEMLVSTSTLYFSYTFLEKKDAPLKYKLLVGALLLIFIIFIPTQFNLPGFNIPNCESDQGPLIYYFYFLEILFLLWLAFFLVRRIIRARPAVRKMTVLFSLGAFLFLASFSGANIVGSLTAHWEILQYGLFGMPVFMALLAYLIIEYKAFNVKLLAAEALVAALAILIGAEFFFIRTPVNRVLTAITLVLILLFGWWLAESVKKEVSQREKLEELTEDLQVANHRLKELDRQKTEFLSIASHQLRTPLSVSKGYLDLIKNGAYGRPSRELKRVLENFEANNERLVKLVDEFLDITRIEQGRTEYKIVPIDVSKIVGSVERQIKGKARAKNIKIIWPARHPKMIVPVDEEKIRNVISNLVDNAIKYSDHGKIILSLRSKNKGAAFSVRDQGLGFSREDGKNFYQKFYRGANVAGVNVGGEGLGLYVCRKFVEGHGGRVWASSGGPGQGSEFGFWLPFKR